MNFTVVALVHGWRARLSFMAQCVSAVWIVLDSLQPFTARCCAPAHTDAVSGQREAADASPYYDLLSVGAAP